MKPLDYVIIAVVAVWFVLAVRSILRHRGGCSCGGTRGCSGCSMGHNAASVVAQECGGTHGCSGCSMSHNAASVMEQDCGGTCGCSGCSMSRSENCVSSDGKMPIHFNEERQL